jgi:diacylglycerol kinase
MKLFKKFKYAYNGIKVACYGSSIKIQLLITLLVIICGFLFSISLIEWIILLVLIGLVLAAELFNSAIEKLCDMFSCGWQLNEVKVIKDMSAGAVALLSLISIIIGILIFIPKLWEII